MNLFKKYYPIVKKELMKYKVIRPGISLGETVLRVNTLEEFQNAVEACQWNILICKYLDMCDEEERKFIDLLYFQNNPICDVGIIFPLSIRACQEWREEILKNLVLMAVNEGLIEIKPFARQI